MQTHDNTGNRLANRLARLKGQVEFPEAWKAEEGDTLAGEAVGWETVTITSDDGTERPCEVLTLRTQDGTERSVWTWHTVLRNELIGKVDAGDFVAIHYRGRRKKQSGDGGYASYRVAIDKATEKTDADVDTPGFGQGDLPEEF